jgi:hypothetical protein
MTRPAADHRPPAGSAGFRRGLTIEGSRSLVSGARVGAAFRVVRSGAIFRGTTMGSRILPVIAAAMLMGPLAAAAQVRLITDEEARAPSQPAPTTRAITRGPGVRLLTPTEVPARSFALKLAFEPRGGTAIDPQSLRVEYLKQPPVDLTPRVRAGLQGLAIELPQVTVPAGHHPLRVSIRDAEGREGSALIHLTAR